MTATCSALSCSGVSARLLRDDVRLCIDHLLALQRGETVALVGGGRLAITVRWPKGQSPRMRQTLTPRFWRWLEVQRCGN